MNSAAYEELKESNRRLEAEIDALIARSPALREAMWRQRIERLTARNRELLVKVVARQSLIKTKSEFRFLPAGRHLISPAGSGPMIVLVTPQAAVECEAQRQIILGEGKLPIFDFEHQDGAASFYPHEFFWRDGGDGGVFVRGLWTAAGRRAVAGEYRFFSPTFATDKSVGPPYPIRCLVELGGSMGGLVRAGAFGDLLRLR